MITFLKLPLFIISEALSVLKSAGVLRLAGAPLVRRKRCGLYTPAFWKRSGRKTFLWADQSRKKLNNLSFHDSQLPVNR